MSVVSGPSPSLTLPLLMWIAVPISAIPAPLSTQTVDGRLLEQGTARPIPSGLVTLLGANSQEVDRAETDSLGRFTLESPEPGAFYIRAERIGYRTKTDGVLEIDEGGEITIAFYLRPEPVEVEGVEATGERTDWIERNQRRFLEGQGFYRRMSAGFGHFITPEEIEERPPWSPRDLFKKIPGLSVPVRNPTGLDWATDKVSFDRCSPFTVWVDGMLVWHSKFDGSAWPMQNQIDVEEVAAVEVYSRISSLPLQYTISGSNCAIVLWTK